jgi:hypothetical protein
MDKPLDELYLDWLYRQVGDPTITNPNRTYWRILKQLYCKEFVWIVPNDDNRIADGRDLRYEFVDDINLRNVDAGWYNLGCSMLELLVGLSRRFSFECDGEPRDWFWHMMDNIKLRRHSDGKSWDEAVVNDILDRIIWRQYKYDGRGGLFPLKDAREDQTKIELWYQLSAYIIEMT